MKSPINRAGHAENRQRRTVREREQERGKQSSGALWSLFLASFARKGTRLLTRRFSSWMRIAKGHSIKNEQVRASQLMHFVHYLCMQTRCIVFSYIRTLLSLSLSHCPSPPHLPFVHALRLCLIYLCALGSTTATEAVSQRLWVIHLLSSPDWGHSYLPCCYIYIVKI